MDIHRSFAQVAFLEGGVIKEERRLELTRDAVLAFAQTLRPDDEVVLEATGNTAAVVRLVRPHVGKVAIANPVQLRAIAYARVKTDKIDAAMLARIQASGFLPEVWIADEATLEQRRLAWPEVTNGPKL
jgi:transposase